MLKKFFMKQALSSQMKDVPKEEQEKILDMIEKNPAFFEKLAAELQEAMKSGRPQNQVLMEVMEKHKAELGRIVGK